MKVCPDCKQTYNDDSLNFCFADGTTLNRINEQSDSAPTVFIGQTLPTNQNQPRFETPNVNQSAPQFIQNTPANFQPVRAKKSRAWMWILGILGVIILFGGIGFVGLVMLLASMSDDTNSNSSSSNLSVKTGSNVKKDDSNNVKDVLTDDFSEWKEQKTSTGTTTRVNGDFVMSSSAKGYFYVLVSGSDEMTTSDAITKLTVRNINGILNNTGYGLVIGSDMKVAIMSDYAFLIDSAKQSYRIVQHINKKEVTIADWNRFPAIKSGTQNNELETRDQNGKISFYINGVFVTTIDNKINNKKGVFGIYSGDGIPVGFSKLTIEK